METKCKAVAPQQRGIFGRRKLVTDACDFTRDQKARCCETGMKVENLDAVVLLSQITDFLAGCLLPGKKAGRNPQIGA